MQRDEPGIGDDFAPRQVQRLQLRQGVQMGEPGIGDVFARADVRNPAAGYRRHCCQLRESGIVEIGNGDPARVRQTKQKAVEFSKLASRNTQLCQALCPDLPKAFIGQAQLLSGRRVETTRNESFHIIRQFI